MDTVEPALCTLSTVCWESGFLQAVRSISNQHYPIGYTSEERLDLYRPFAEGHQFEAWFLSFSPSVEEAWTALLTSLNERARHLYWNRNCAQLMKKWTAWGLMHSGVDSRRKAIYESSAAVFGDRVWQARHGQTGDERRLAARQLLSISPESEAAVAVCIEADWQTVEGRAEEWEKQFASSPLVLMELGEAYHKSMRYADAERCLKRSFSLDPCRGVAESLAWCFYEDGDEDRWLKQMERAAEMGKSATLTDRLTSEGVYADIARRLLWQGKTSEAFKYAEQADRSGSAWGFSLIARCYEVKGDFTNAEKYIRRRSKSYGRPFDWYFWCHRTGQGDLQSAKASISDDLLEGYHASSLGDEVVTSMLFHRLNGELEEAINRLTLGHSLSDVQGAWSFLHWELMKLEFRKAGNTDLLPNAYELQGNIEPEDDVLRVEFTPDEKRMRILNQGIAHHEYFTESGRPVDPREFFVELRRHFVSEEKQPLNLKRLDWIVRAYGSPGSRTNMLYWIGKVLLLDDRKAEAIPYLKMAATSTYSHKHNAVLAGFELAELGMASGRLRSTEMEFEEAEQFRLYDEALSWTAPVCGETLTRSASERPVRRAWRSD